ncbi:unnamed protein product [Colletotrichum noveboracense]|uniref:Uncharacterized protein n=1 Tax=Colletotrichum noveboracense TaxID=2664923 RepID=A0A9W4S6Q3_9PEZI|nr:unnamed protein product [Colletotrichum noveboracense]
MSHFNMGLWMRTDDAEVASRLGSPSCSSFSLSVLLVPLASEPPIHPPSLLSLLPHHTLHHHLLTGVPFSASSPFARFIYPPVDFSLFSRPATVSPSLWLYPADTHTLSLSLTQHTNTRLNNSIIASPNISSRSCPVDPALSTASTRPLSGSQQQHDKGPAKALRCPPDFPFFPG